MSIGISRILVALTAAGCLLLAGGVQAEIYKTVDENGNVIYTDQPPDDAAEPMKLPGLSVIEMVKSAPPSAVRAETEEAGALSIRDLRRGYRDFAISKPAAEETLWGTNNEAIVGWTTEFGLQPGLTVTIYVDGEAHDTTRQQEILVRQLNRGAHTVTAEIRDSRNRRIATAEPVTFYIQQYSRHYGANRNTGN